MDAESELKLLSLLRNTRTAALGTLRDGAPFVSMTLVAPAQDLCTYFILASTLAVHTRDMQTDARVSLMCSEPDTGAGDPQQLARVSLQGSARRIARTDADFAAAQQLYVGKFPQSAPLFGFGDFDLYALEVKNGRYVAGFARAFNISADTLGALAQKG